MTRLARTEYPQTLTLRMIRDNHPCEEGWKKLLAGLGKTTADDEPLTIAEVYRIIGFDGAVWCLRALPDDRLPRHFQAWCAERVLHIFEAERPGDMRIRAQIMMLRNDEASQEERNTAWDAAWDAAWDTAWDTALDTARDAAKDAAGAAARDAAWDAARDAQERHFRKMIGVDQ